jgi:hypothetical protein
VNIVSGSTPNNTPLTLPVTVIPASATLRIITQPINGSLGITNNVLKYFPAAGFAGADTFTYAAWDGAKNSLLATGRVTVTQGAYSLGVVAHAPTNYPSGWPVAFAAVSTVTNYAGAVSYDWNFGDGSPHDTNQFPTHAYANAARYAWSVTATALNVTATASGNIEISAPVVLNLALTVGGNGQLVLSWPGGPGGGVLEESQALGAGAQWTPVTNPPAAGGGTVNIPVSRAGKSFYRVRQAW